MPHRYQHIERAIGQERAFTGAGQAAVVATLVVADGARRRFESLAAEVGLTFQQYNVLRILRGAGRDGLPTLAVAERLIEQSPGTTRMMERLERKRLIERVRATHDQRVVLCRLAAKGSALLARLDQRMDDLDGQLFATLSEHELDVLARLLDRIQQHLASGATA